MTRMKALLLLLSVVTLSAAAAVGEKAAEVEVVPEVKVEVPEVKVVPEVEVYPDVEVPEVAAVEDEHPVAAPEGRFVPCPPGWDGYGGSCYLFVSSRYSWNSAQSHCISQGASLASVGDFHEHAFLESLTMRPHRTDTWIGGFYFQGWRWTDGSPFTYQNWYHQYSGSSYPCVYLHPYGGWTNWVCSTGRPFICEKTVV